MSLKSEQTQTTTPVTIEDSLRVVGAYASSFHVAGLGLVCSMTSFMLVSCHLQETNARLTLKDAKERLTGVCRVGLKKGRSQTETYVGKAAWLYERLVSAKRFGGIVAEIAELDNADAQAEHLLSWLRDDFKITSLEQLIARSKAKQASAAKPDEKEPETKAAEAISRAISKQITAEADENLETGTVATAIAQSVPRDASIDYVRPFVQRMSLDMLEMLAGLVKTEIKARQEAQARAKQVAKDKAKESAETPAPSATVKTKGTGATAH